MKHDVESDEESHRRDQVGRRLDGDVLRLLFRYSFANLGNVGTGTSFRKECLSLDSHSEASVI